MENSKLLLVDDDRLVLATLSTGLEQYGYSVTAVTCITDAMTAAAAEKPDLAILDMRMPGGSGVDLAREFLKRQIPFIFLSAYGEAETVRQAIIDGALGYLVKPLNISQIVPTINAALARAAELRQLKTSEANLNVALNQSRHVSVAIGILMHKLALSEQQAFENLRTRARSSRRKIDEVAAELIDAVASHSKTENLTK